MADETPAKSSKSPLTKYKWWLIGGLAVIAVLVFFFTSKSNSNTASENAQTSGSQDNSDQSDLWSELALGSLMNDMEGGNNSYAQPGWYEGGSGTSTSTTGTSTDTSSSGTTSSSQTVPSGYTQISASQASTLLSSQNYYNPSGEKSQNPFQINNEWYAGPLETSEINNYNSKHK